MPRKEKCTNSRRLNLWGRQISWDLTVNPVTAQHVNQCRLVLHYSPSFCGEQKLDSINSCQHEGFKRQCSTRFNLLFSCCVTLPSKNHPRIPEMWDCSGTSLKIKQSVIYRLTTLSLLWWEMWADCCYEASLDDPQHSQSCTPQI